MKIKSSLKTQTFTCNVNFVTFEYTVLMTDKLILVYYDIFTLQDVVYIALLEYLKKKHGNEFLIAYALFKKEENAYIVTPVNSTKENITEMKEILKKGGINKDVQTKTKEII